METYIVSARKYRPQRFEDVVGQAAITNTLKTAIASNHLAQALLFCGPRGVGKTTCARILAKAINLNSTDVSLTGGDEDFSFNIFELDAASNNSVDDIRNLIDQVRFAPQQGKFKVYIIDEVHMLSQAAFNAFLKTLEEPPSHAVFILATTEKHKIIPTILSRCQIYDFKRIQIADMVKHLSYVAEKEGVKAEEEALHLIAQKADGAMRDALSLFDRMVSFSPGEVSYATVLENLNILDYQYYFRLTDHLLKQDYAGALVLFDEILNRGFDGHLFVGGLGEHLRNLLVSRDQSTLKLLEVADNTKAKYHSQAQAASDTWLISALDALQKVDGQYKNAPNQRLLVEVLLMRLCRTDLLGSDEKKKSFSLSKPESVSAPPAVPANIPQPKSEGIPITKPVVQFTEQEKTAVVEEPKKPIPPPALPKVPSSTLSILDYLSAGEKAEKEKTSASAPIGDAKDEFTEDQLKSVWENFCEDLREKGFSRLSAALGAKSIERKGLELHLELESRTLESELQDHRVNLMTMMRTKLNNFALDLKVTVSEQQAEKRPYLPDERYWHMVSKNGLLKELRDQLDLDIQ